MKKIIFLFIIFLYCFNVSAGSIYISKRDIDTDQYVNDCDFLLYDEYGNVVDSWVQDDSTHISSVPVGSYRLIERPFIIDGFIDSLSQSYELNIDSDDILELTIYNTKIETPRNLSFNKNYIYAFFLMFLGFVMLLYNRKFNQV